MQGIPRFRQASLHSLKRRLGTLLRRHLLGRFLPVKRVRLVRIGDARFKRLTFPDAWSAAQAARRLEPFRRHRVFPAVLAQSGSELLLEYVEGRALPDPLDDAGCERLADFFAALYAQDRRCVETRGAGFVDAVQQDLGFLARVGVLAAAAHADLARAADALAPSRIHVGTDYLDPIPRNFVLTPDARLVAIDVEELLADQLLGSGVAKAALRIPGVRRETLLEGIRRGAGLELAPVLPFVELSFLAGWMKRALLKGRAPHVRPELFEPFRTVR